MAKIWNEDDIKEVLKELENTYGVSCENMKVTISKRMTTTKGCCTTRKKFNGTVEGVEFKFSILLTDGNYTEEDVIATIKHEYAHLYANVKHSKFCDHNIEWQKACRMMGIDDTPFFLEKPINQELEDNRKLKDNYIVTCKECNNTFGRVRFPKGIEHFTRRYICTCGGKFEVEEIKK